MKMGNLIKNSMLKWSTGTYFIFSMKNLPSWVLVVAVSVTSTKLVC